MTGDDPQRRLAAVIVAQKEVISTLQKQQDSALKKIFSGAQLKQIDKWIAGQNDPAIDRAEAIRRLVELGLRAKGKS